MPLLIGGLLYLAILSLLIWDYRRSKKKENYKKRIHETNLACPYRVVSDGGGNYRIQHYEKRGESWLWIFMSSKFTDLEEVKKEYCTLLAKFRYNESKEIESLAKYLLNKDKYEKSIEVHEILDMSSAMDLCNEILEKMKADGSKKKRTKKKEA